MKVILEHVAIIGRELALSFGDGVEAYLELALLRRACPCAVCQGEPDALGRIIRPTVEYGPDAFFLSKIENIGGYAIQLFWVDGHSSGIYSYSYLKRLQGLSS